MMVVNKVSSMRKKERRWDDDDDVVLLVKKIERGTTWRVGKVGDEGRGSLW